MVVHMNTATGMVVLVNTATGMVVVMNTTTGMVVTSGGAATSTTTTTHQHNKNQHNTTALPNAPHTSTRVYIMLILLFNITSALHMLFSY
jgi:hypothetical protein